MCAQRTLTIDGPSPWGFRIKGGYEFRSPVVVERVNPGSKAQQSGLKEGECIIEINGASTAKKTHGEVKTMLTSNKDKLTMILSTELQAKAPSIESIVAACSSPTATTSFVFRKSVTICPNAGTITTPVLVPKSEANSSSAASSSSNAAPAPAAAAAAPSAPCSSNGCANSQPSSGQMVCSGCKGPITTSGYLQVGPKFYHKDHLLCKMCGQDLRGKPIVEDDDGALVCQQCIVAKNTTLCSACGVAITDKGVKVRGLSFHATCFVCGKCKRKISGSYFMVGKTITCEKCSNEENKMCNGCDKQIGEIDSFLEAGNNFYHVACFKCHGCKKQIDQGGQFFLSRIKKVVCCSEECARIN